MATSATIIGHSYANVHRQMHCRLIGLVVRDAEVEPAELDSGLHDSVVIVLERQVAAAGCICVLCGHNCVVGCIDIAIEIEVATDVIGTIGFEVFVLVLAGA